MAGRMRGRVKVANPSDPVMWCSEAAARMAAGDDSAAVFCYQESLKIRPGVSDVWFNMGCLYERMGDRPAALGCFTTAAKMFASDVRFSAERARMCAEMGRFSDAVEAVDAALAIDSYSPLLLSNKAGYLIFCERYEEAAKASDAALAIDPGYGSAFLHKAHALVSMVRVSEARGVLEAGLSALPDDSRLMKMLANVCIRSDDFSAGRVWAQRYVELVPGDDEGWCLLGSACAYLDDFEGAEEAFLEAVRLKPGNKGYRANLKSVRKMR